MRVRRSRFVSRRACFLAAEGAGVFAYSSGRGYVSELSSVHTCGGNLSSLLSSCVMLTRPCTLFCGDVMTFFCDVVMALSSFFVVSVSACDGNVMAYMCRHMLSYVVMVVGFFCRCRGGWLGAPWGAFGGWALPLVRCPVFLPRWGAFRVACAI